MRLKFLFISLSLDSSITPRLCKVKRHGLAKELETVDFVNGVLGTLHLVEDYEGLASALQATFCDNVDNVAIFAKDLTQSFD